MGADVIVAGGLNNHEGTCPFTYEYIDNYFDLVARLRTYEEVLYHWPPSWAVQAIRDSGIISVEFVHRVDTAECDKSVPDLIISHSQYVCDYIKKKFHRDCRLVPNVVDTDFYLPKMDKKNKVGAVTSYYETKGIDILIKAWARVSKKVPEYELHLYGAGSQRDKFEKLAQKLHADVKFHGAIANSKIAYDDLKLVISASRIEGLPIALLEALSCNLPILASDIEGHRIINELAVEKGFAPPICLFETENDKDLSEKLYDMILTLDNMIVNTREVALAVFSPVQHINGIEEAFYKAKYQHKDCVRNLYELKENIPIQYFFYQTASSLTSDIVSYPIDVDHDNFIYAQTEITDNMDSLMFEVETRIYEYCNVYIQVDWIYSTHVTSCGEGIYLDHDAHKIFTMKNVPSNRPSAVKISIRPNPNEHIEVMGIRMWAAKEEYIGK